MKWDVHSFDSECESEVAEEEEKGNTLSWPVGQNKKYHMLWKT